MAKEFTICRICKENLESSMLLESFDMFLTFVDEIKEVLGVELLNDAKLPPYICQQCNSCFITAQKLRQRCIESNEYFEIFLNGVQKHQETPVKPEPAVNSLDDTEKRCEVKIELPENDDFKREPEECTESPTKPLNNDDKKEFKLTRKQRTKTTVPVICDICGNIFKAKHVFELHLRRHTNNKPYECELCPSSFYTNSELKRHMRRHTGEKPYECKFCHRKFSDYGTHIKHERTHTNDRPFSCMQCGKSFSCAFVLKNHMLIHTGERAFRCDVCNKSFGRQHNLTSHMKSIYHQRNVFKMAVIDGVS